VVDLQESGTAATWSPAPVLVPGQDFPAHARRDGGRVATAFPADNGIAAQAICLGPAQFAFAGVGWDRHFSFRLMDMNLDRRPVSKVPPGGV